MRWGKGTDYFSKGGGLRRDICAINRFYGCIFRLKTKKTSEKASAIQKN